MIAARAHNSMKQNIFHLEYLSCLYKMHCCLLLLVVVWIHNWMVNVVMCFRLCYICSSDDVLCFRSPWYCSLIHLRSIFLRTSGTKYNSWSIRIRLWSLDFLVPVLGCSGFSTFSLFENSKCYWASFDSKS